MVRTFSPICNPMPLVSELPLKLARKCMDTFGTASWDGEVDIHSIGMYQIIGCDCGLYGKIRLDNVGAESSTDRFDLFCKKGMDYKWN